MPFDALGNYIPDDEEMSLDAMKYELAKKGSMPLRPDGSDVPFLASEVPNIRVPVTPKEPPKPYSTSTDFAQAMADRLGISAIPQALMAMGTGFASEVAKGMGNKELSKAIQYEPTSRVATDVLAGLEEAPRAITGSHMGFGPTPELWATTLGRGVNADDVRVLAKRGIETGREIRAIPEDFSNAQSGVIRQNYKGEPTYGAKLQGVAEDVGDVMARQEARRNRYETSPRSSVEVFGDMVPETNLYAVRNTGEGQMLRPTTSAGGVEPRGVDYGETEDFLREISPPLSVNKPEDIIDQYERTYMSDDTPATRRLNEDWERFQTDKIKEMYPSHFTKAESFKALRSGYPANVVQDMKLKWFQDYINEKKAQGFEIPSMEEYFARAQAAHTLTKKIVPNLIQKYIGTPNDPFLELAKKGITMNPADEMRNQYEIAPTELEKARTKAGFEPKGEVADKLMPVAESKLATQSTELDKLIADQADIARTEGMMVPYPDGRIDPLTGQVEMATNPNYAQYTNKIGAMRKAIEDTEEEIRNLRTAQAYENVADASIQTDIAENYRFRIPAEYQQFYPSLYSEKPKDTAISPTFYKTPDDAPFFNVNVHGLTRAGVLPLAKDLVKKIMSGEIPPEQVPNLAQPHTITKFMSDIVAPRIEKEKAARLAMKDYKVNVENHFLEVLNTIPDSMKVGTNAKLLWMDDATPEMEINQNLSDETFVLDHCIGNSGNGRGTTNLITGDERSYIPYLDPVTGQKFKGAGSTSSYMDEVLDGKVDIMSIRDSKTGLPVGTIELQRQVSKDGDNEYRINYVSGYKNHNNKHDGIDPKYREALRDALNLVKNEIYDSAGNENRSGVYDMRSNSHLNSLRKKLDLPKTHDEANRAWAGVQKNIMDNLDGDRYITIDQAEEALKEYKQANPVPTPAMVARTPQSNENAIRQRNIIMQGLSRENLDTARQFNAARIVADSNRFEVLPLAPSQMDARPLAAYRGILQSIERRAQQSDMSDYQVFEGLMDYVNQIEGTTLRPDDFNLTSRAELDELKDQLEAHAEAVGQLAHYADVLQRNGYRSPLPSEQTGAPEWNTYQRYLGELPLNNPSDLRTRLRDTIEHADIREIDPQLDEIQRENFKHLLEIHIRALEQAEHYPAPTAPAVQRGIPLRDYETLVQNTMNEIGTNFGEATRQEVAQIMADAVGSQMDVRANERPVQISNFLTQAAQYRPVGGQPVSVRNALRVMAGALDQANADLQNARNAPAQTTALPTIREYGEAVITAEQDMPANTWSDVAEILNEIQNEVTRDGGLYYQHPTTIVNRLREQADLQDQGGEPDTAVGLRNLAGEIARLVPANPPASMALANQNAGQRNPTRQLVQGQEALSNSIIDTLNDDPILAPSLSDRLNALQWRENLVDDPAGLVRNIRIEADAEANAGNDRFATSLYDIANLIADENGETLFTPAGRQAVEPRRTPRDMAETVSAPAHQTLTQRIAQVDSLANAINEEIRSIPTGEVALRQAEMFYSDPNNLPASIIDYTNEYNDAERIANYLLQHVRSRLANRPENRGQERQVERDGFFNRLNHIIDDTVLTASNNPAYANMQDMPTVLEREINSYHSNSENLPQLIEYLRNDAENVETNVLGDEWHQNYVREIRHLIDRLERLQNDMPQMANSLTFHQEAEPAQLPAPAPTAEFPDTEQLRILARMHTNEFTGAADAFRRTARDIRDMTPEDRLNALDRMVRDTSREAGLDEGMRNIFGVDSPAGMSQLNSALRALREDLRDRGLLTQLQAPVENDRIGDAIAERIQRVNQEHLGISQQFDAIVQAAQAEFDPSTNPANFIQSLHHRANSVDRAGDREAMILANQLRHLAADVNDVLHTQAPALPAPDPVAQHFDRVEQGVNQPQGMGALSQAERNMAVMYSTNLLNGDRNAMTGLAPNERQMVQVLTRYNEPDPTLINELVHRRLINTLTSETYNPATDGEALIRLAETRSGMFAELDEPAREQVKDIVEKWNFTRFPNYRPPEEGMGLEPEGHKRGGYIRKMNDGGQPPKLSPYEQFKIDNAERIRQGQEDIANRNKYDPYKGSDQPVNTPRPPRGASGSAGVIPSGSGPSSLDRPRLYNIGGKVYMEVGGQVKPVPNIPQTPEKTRPNTTDNVPRKPVDEGFREVFEKYRNPPKPSGSAGTMPSGSGASYLDRPHLYAGGGRIHMDEGGRAEYPMMGMGGIEPRQDTRTPAEYDTTGLPPVTGNPYDVWETKYQLNQATRDKLNFNDPAYTLGMNEIRASTEMDPAWGGYHSSDEPDVVNIKNTGREPQYYSQVLTHEGQHLQDYKTNQNKFKPKGNIDSLEYLYKTGNQYLNQRAIENNYQAYKDKFIADNPSNEFPHRQLGAYYNADAPWNERLADLNSIEGNLKRGERFADTPMGKEILNTPELQNYYYQSVRPMEPKALPYEPTVFDRIRNAGRNFQEKSASGKSYANSALESLQEFKDGGDVNIDAMRLALMKG